MPIVRRTLAQEAYQEIRALILAGEMPPGSRVTMRPLSERLNLSATPIKSALAALERDGFLVAHAHRGFFVPEVSLRDIVEIYELREALDPVAARKVAQRVDAAAFVGEVLEPVYVAQCDSWGRADIAGYRDLDVRFHQEIWRACGNGRLVTVTENLGGQIRLGWDAQLPDRVPRALAEHRAIMDAIAVRDTRAAESASRAHVRQARTSYEQALLKYAGDGLGGVPK